MHWTVNFTSSAAKQYAKLPEGIRARVDALVLDMQLNGPVRGNWKNYGKLGKTAHHCHVKSGRPTYVVCWDVKDNKLRIIEVYYAGTHENAPY